MVAADREIGRHQGCTALYRHWRSFLVGGSVLAMGHALFTFGVARLPALGAIPRAFGIRIAMQAIAVAGFEIGRMGARRRRVSVLLVMLVVQEHGYSKQCGGGAHIFVVAHLGCNGGCHQSQAHRAVPKCRKVRFIP